MPRAPKKCGKAECEERVRGRKFCPEHTVAWEGSTRGQAPHDDGLARRVRREEPTCRDCGKPTQCAGHIIPAAYGGPYVRSNLKGQCNTCNYRQINEDRQRWLRGEFGHGGLGGV